LKSEKETGKFHTKSMDRGDNIDDWFTGDGYTKKGNEIIAKIQKYKADMKVALGTDKKYAAIL
jgi:hypothetical protein